MVWLMAVAVAAANPSPNASRGVTAEALATVRILSGVRLKLDSAANMDAPVAHDSKIIDNGTKRPARLIEFE